MWDRACVDAASVPAPGGGKHTGETRQIVARSAANTICSWDQQGLPLVAKISGAQVNESRFPSPLAEVMPAVKWLSGHSRKGPGELQRRDSNVLSFVDGMASRR
jgi:hypothetical protein